MEVKESYRVLELEIGATRAEVDAAFFRLIERWHPDRAASGGPEAVREAQRMVQAINEAHQTLAKIAPSSAKAPAPPPASTAPPTRAKTSAPAPASTAPPTGNKPRIAPLSIGQPDLNRPPPSPPPPETWAARTAPAAGAPPPPTPAPSPAPPPPNAPPPPRAPAPQSATPPTPPPAAGAPEPAPMPAPVDSAPETPDAPPPSLIERLRQVMAFYDGLFPPDSVRRRFGPYVLAAALIVVLFLGKCAFSSRGHRSAREPDPKTTGRLVVKSNLANATVEARLIPTASDATTATFNAAIGQVLAGLPPGKYAVKARADGWPEVHEEVNVDAGRVTDLAMNFQGGSLRLDTDPSGATVRQGETDFGRTPLVIPQLPPGECQLSLEYPTWPAASFKTTIAAGKESAATVRLPHGKLTVETTPAGTTILLGGRILGQTPLTLERFPAGTWKLTLRAKGFPVMELPVTVEDEGDVKIHPELGAVFPELDPTALFRNVWVPDNSDNIAPPFDGLSGPAKPQNGVIRNLNRKRLYDYWLRKRYHYSAIVKSYDRTSGQIEFAEQQNEFSKFHVLANLSTDARNDPDLTAQLTKGATFAFYGRLTAVEESRWIARTITFEFSTVEPLR